MVRLVRIILRLVLLLIRLIRLLLLRLISMLRLRLTHHTPYLIVVVPFSVGLGLGAALLIQSVQRGREFYKTIYFLPVMASLLAMAIVWEFMLHPTIGVLNETLQGGCDSPVIHGLFTGSWYGADPLTSWYGHKCANGFPLWLGDRDYALWTICFIGIWQSFGFNMVLYLAGLTSVPKDLYHAAEMDGTSSAWERFRLITWLDVPSISAA